MGFMPGVVSADKYFERLDTLLNRHPRECLDALRRAESEGPDKSVYEIAVDVDRGLVSNQQEPDPAGRAVDDEAISRIKTFWYSDRPDELYFQLEPTDYPAAVRRQIARVTMIRALELAGDGSRIRTHYCCIGSNFEGVVMRPSPQDRIVQVLLITGAYRREVKPPSGLDYSRHENVWITSIGKRVHDTIKATPGLTVEPTAGLETAVQSPVWQADTDVVWASGAKRVGTIRTRCEL